VILFRNVAIYLEPDEAFRVWGHLAARLRPGGVLVTGKAERPPASLGFERIEPCLFQLNPLK
jgi:chemotaxis methyl-accepting protein methylase